MKIEYREGNLLISPLQVIAHGCNAQGVMGSGIARAIREKYPEVFKGYIDHSYQHGLKLGKNVWVNTLDNRTVVNSITQFGFGKDGQRYVSYDAIAQCMGDINSRLSFLGISEIGLPKIGAGLGGGNWNIIATIIEEELVLVKPIVYIL